MVSTGCQCCITLRSQETWERVGQWSGYTYYWSRRPQGHLEAVTVAVADRLVPMITKVTPVSPNDTRITHTLSVISMVSVYAPTGVK